MEYLQKKLAPSKRSGKTLERKIETSEPDDAIAELKSFGDALRAA